MQISSTAASASAGSWSRANQAQGTQDSGQAGVADSTGSSADESGEARSDESSFGGAIAVAELLANSAKAAPKEGNAGMSMRAVSAKKGSSGQTPEGPSVQASGKLDKFVPQGAGGGVENGALIQKMAVSSNTGAEIAGLKPWSRDWVMEGGLHRHPSQQTLIQGQSGGDSADVAAQLASLARLVGASAEESSGSVQGRSKPLSMSESIMEEPTESLSRKPSLSGDDFVSLRQSVVSGAVPLTSSAGESVQSGAGPKSRVGQGVSGTGVSTGISSDMLGLIHPEMNGKAALGASSLPFAAGMDTVKLSGAVVPGSMQRNRLSSESVGGVSENIRLLTAKGGGEIRIRLKPDHLGEIHLRVSSGGKTGNEIGLQIQASDDRAKQIIEESISSLKDSLSGQNLSLSKVDVQVSQSVSASSGSNQSQFDSQSQGQNRFAQDFGASLDQGSGRRFDQGSESGEGTRPEGLRSASRAKVFDSPSRSVASGTSRIDVMA
ncbi:MAG: flagellar hook-length control protein FliK [Oligoflexia bacterium]